MDFTREPIIQTVITARDGHRIVVRNSKTSGQEEFFVDALEVVTFGNTCFFRNLERPRAFIVPASDYEVLEVREPRLALKTPSIEGIVKIGSALHAPLVKHEASASSSRTQITGATPHSYNASSSHKEKNTYDDYKRENSPSREYEHNRRERSDIREKETHRHDIDRKESSFFAPSERRGDRQAEHMPTASIPPHHMTDTTMRDDNMYHIDPDMMEATSPGFLDSKADSYAQTSIDRKKDRRRGLRRRRGSSNSSRNELRHDEHEIQESSAYVEEGEKRSSLESTLNEAHALDEGQQSLQSAIETLHPGKETASFSIPVKSKTQHSAKERHPSRKSAETAINHTVEVTHDVIMPPTGFITSILPPPTTLIRDDLARLRNNELYKGAFYIREADSVSSDPDIKQQTHTQEENTSTDEEAFLVSPSLQFDDEDDDDINSNAYKASPVIEKTHNAQDEPVMAAVVVAQEEEEKTTRVASQLLSTHMPSCDAEEDNTEEEKECSKNSRLLQDDTFLSPASTIQDEEPRSFS